MDDTSHVMRISTTTSLCCSGRFRFLLIRRVALASLVASPPMTGPGLELGQLSLSPRALSVDGVLKYVDIGCCCFLEAARGLCFAVRAIAAPRSRHFTTHRTGFISFHYGAPYFTVFSPGRAPKRKEINIIMQIFHHSVFVTRINIRSSFSPGSRCKQSSTMERSELRRKFTLATYHK